VIALDGFVWKRGRARIVGRQFATGRAALVD